MSCILYFEIFLNQNHHSHKGVVLYSWMIYVYTRPGWFDKSNTVHNSMNPFVFCDLIVKKKSLWPESTCSWQSICRPPKQAPDYCIPNKIQRILPQTKHSLNLLDPGTSQIQELVIHTHQKTRRIGQHVLINS